MIPILAPSPLRANPSHLRSSPARIAAGATGFRIDRLDATSTASFEPAAMGRRLIDAFRAGYGMVWAVALRSRWVERAHVVSRWYDERAARDAEADVGRLLTGLPAADHAGDVYRAEWVHVAESPVFRFADAVTVPVLDVIDPPASRRIGPRDLGDAVDVKASRGLAMLSSLDGARLALLSNWRSAAHFLEAAAQVRTPTSASSRVRSTASRGVRALSDRDVEPASLVCELVGGARPIRA